MILHEATIGGVIYLDWIDSEMALPEAERVAFEYGAISNRDKVSLIYKNMGGNTMPDPADVCMAAIDGLGKKVRNLKGPDGSPLDTIDKMLKCKDADLTIAYIIANVGMKIWARQNGGEEGLKN